jgi:hypothetical protein
MVLDRINLSVIRFFIISMTTSCFSKIGTSVSLLLDFHRTELVLSWS